MINELGFLPERTFVAVGQSIYSLTLFIIGVVYLMMESRRLRIAAKGTEPRPHILDRFGNQLAAAVTMHMAGEAVSRTWGAVLLVLFAHHVNIGIWEDRYPLAFAGSFISMLGVLWKVRILSPANVRQWLWAVLLVIAFGLGAFLAYVPTDDWFEAALRNVSRETLTVPQTPVSGADGWSSLQITQP